MGPPAPGLTAEYFSVRWTGWLVAPASGRYLFHATVDDGMRIWLNDQLILNEWRPQPVQSFTVAAKLQAGEPYRLRIEYFQDILDTRAQLTWERPDVPLAPPPSSWRNLWGLRAEKLVPDSIPTRYLFSRNPRPATAQPALLPATRTLPAAKATPQRPTTLSPVAKPAAASRAALPRSRPAPATPLAPVRAAVKPVGGGPPVLAVGDTARTGQLARLAVGEAVNLPELCFEQGQALLLPPVRAALDGLAGVLRAQPSWRFEVQGHTDNVGNAELNRQLSQQRAEVVCLYLTAHGVAEGRLRPVGYGGSQPVADNTDPAQRPRNRRVVLQRL